MKVDFFRHFIVNQQISNGQVIGVMDGFDMKLLQFHIILSTMKDLNVKAMKNIWTLLGNVD